MHHTQSNSSDGASIIPNSGQPSAPTQPLSEDIAFLHKYGIGYPALIHAEARARLFEVAPASVLIQQNGINENDYYRCVALELGLPFTEQPEGTSTPDFDLPDAQTLNANARMIALENKTVAGSAHAQRSFYLAPDCRQLTGMQKLLAQNPDLSERINMTTLSANKQSLIQRASKALLGHSIDFLSANFPDLSAKTTLTPKQAVSLLVLIQIVLALSFLSSGTVLLALHLTATGFYLGCVGLRLFASLSLPCNPPGPISTLTDRSQDHQLPIYSVLVALYKEASQVDDLITSLKQIDWPLERLEIKLVCEDDDHATISAIERALAAPGHTHFSIIRVPVALPRTKPKALNFALSLCVGHYVVVYDAEDRPHPLQCREAHETFVNGSETLACLQAPLTILNHSESWLSRLFTIEYSCLFDGLLPALSRVSAPFPLGGTSNHFKLAVLKEIGSWDPYNVTEDADLGMRLSRAGCRIKTLSLPTYEEAPASLSIWLKQRTRWFKGWYQTWLVHNRRPLSLMADLKFKGSLAFHLMITGMIVSALVHPILLYFIGSRLYLATQSSVSAVLNNPLFWLDVTTISLGYCAFAILAWRTLHVRRLRRLWPSLWALPFYWLLLSAAAWRAVWHLIQRPHEWEKTPHRLKLRKQT